MTATSRTARPKTTMIPLLWSCLARMRRMSLAWAFIGLAVGVNLGTSAGGGMIAWLAFGLTGVIFLLPMGAAIGVLFDSWRASLVGASCGLIVSLLVCDAGQLANVSDQVSFGILCGALVGATIGPVLRLTAVLVLTALATARGPARAAVAASHP